MKKLFSSKGQIQNGLKSRRKEDNEEINGKYLDLKKKKKDERKLQITAPTPGPTQTPVPAPAPSRRFKVTVNKIWSKFSKFRFFAV